MLGIVMLMIAPTLALLAAPALGAGPATAGPAVTTVQNQQIVDLRPALETKKWKEGKTVFYSDDYIQLVADVRHGKVMSVTPINVTGKSLALRSKKSGTTTPRPCIICYNLDSPLESKCIEVPCWMISILRPILKASPG